MSEAALLAFMIIFLLTSIILGILVFCYCRRDYNTLKTKSQGNSKWNLFLQLLPFGNTTSHGFNSTLNNKYDGGSSQKDDHTEEEITSTWMPPKSGKRSGASKRNESEEQVRPISHRVNHHGAQSQTYPKNNDPGRYVPMGKQQSNVPEYTNNGYRQDQYELNEGPPLPAKGTKTDDEYLYPSNIVNRQESNTSDSGKSSQTFPRAMNSLGPSQAGCSERDSHSYVPMVADNNDEVAIYTEDVYEIEDISERRSTLPPKKDMLTENEYILTLPGDENKASDEQIYEMERKQ